MIVESLDFNCKETWILNEPVCNSCTPGFIFEDGVCVPCEVENNDRCYNCDPQNKKKCLLCKTEFSMNS